MLFSSDGKNCMDPIAALQDDAGRNPWLTQLLLNDAVVKRPEKT